MSEIILSLRIYAWSMRERERERETDRHSEKQTYRDREWRRGAVGEGKHV